MGIYQDGVFRFTLNVPSNYPDGDCPVSIDLGTFCNQKLSKLNVFYKQLKTLQSKALQGDLKRKSLLLQKQR